MSDLTKDELFEIATNLGLEPHPNTGIVKLAAMIKEAETGTSTKKTVVSIKGKPVETKIQRHARLRDDQRKLVRVIVRCNDDQKKDWSSVNVRVSNSLHTFSRNVPFNIEAGWHVEQIILNMLKEKKCIRFKDVMLPNGQKHRESFTSNAYTIEILDPLTKVELKKLASEQAARGSID